MKIDIKKIGNFIDGLKGFVIYLMILLSIMVTFHKIFIWIYEEYEFRKIKIELNKIYIKLNNAKMSGDRQEALELSMPTYIIIKKLNNKGIVGEGKNLNSHDYCYLLAINISRSIDTMIAFGSFEDNNVLVDAFNNCN